jgi:hypothetical protein
LPYGRSIHAVHGTSRRPLGRASSFSNRVGTPVQYQQGLEPCDVLCVALQT